MRAAIFSVAILVGVGVWMWAGAKADVGRADTKVAFPKPAVDEAAPAAGAAGAQETAVLAGGCFWGVQAVFAHVKGVVLSTSGYAGGEAGTATYEQVSTGATGHAESVKVVFDPTQITYGQILMIYFAVAHNPTELNFQGPDYGTQYRSEIFYGSPEQKKIAEAYIAQLGGAKIYAGNIVTRVEPLRGFYTAEEYHQDYLRRHPYEPYIVMNDQPKLERLQKEFPGWYRKD
jgi:peptide-methionine (S)-S-oxide reductase